MKLWCKHDDEWVPVGPFTEFTITWSDSTTGEVFHSVQSAGQDHIPAVRQPLNGLPAILRRHALWFAAWQRRNA